jgi:tetratricopeptide (TPR) repeat protein
MLFVKSLFLVFAITVAGYAQTLNRPGKFHAESNQLQQLQLAEPQLKPLAINARPDKKTIAAIVAVKDGTSLWREGKIEQATAYYQAAVDLQPDLYAAQFNLGVAYLHKREFGAAILAFKQAVSLRPNSATAWESMGLAEYHQQRYPLAVKALEVAQRIAPDRPEINNNLGFAYMFSDRFSEAVASFKQTLELDPAFTPARRGLCSAYSLGGQPEDAVRVCLEAIGKRDHSAVPQYYLGYAYLDLGESKKAIGAFEQSARIEPTTAKIFVGLAFGYYQLKKYDRALSYFQQAHKLDPDTEELLSGLGVVYAQLRKYDQAELTLRAALERDPDHPTNRFNLGIVCLLRKNRECALREYNYLKMAGDPLAKKLFASIYRDKVVDVTAYGNKPRR